MRLGLLYNPRLLCERLAQGSLERRRLARLKNTVAAGLAPGHIDSLELLELLPPLRPRVIYDIGANIGTFTLLAKAVYPEAQIHAFEPLPQHAAGFRKTTKPLRDVCLHEIALGPRPARMAMKVTDFSDASSLLSLAETGRQQWHIKQVAEVEVQVERLDDWIDAHDLPAPDLLKLDVQGFEWEVLRGSVRALARAQWVLLEVSFQDFYEGQCRFDQLVASLAEAGFQIYALGQGTSLGRPLVQSDILFRRSGTGPPKR